MNFRERGGLVLPGDEKSPGEEAWRLPETRPGPELAYGCLCHGWAVGRLHVMGTDR